MVSARAIRHLGMVVGNMGRSANSFKARVVVAPLVLAMEMGARLWHQRVAARSLFHAVSRSGKSGALAHSLHLLPAYSFTDPPFAS